jgi:hypothetical protein
MNKAIVPVALLGICGCFHAVDGAEFALINDEITFTDTSSGFTFYYDTNKGPTNWVSPDNYYDGQFHCRFEVLAQPTSSPSYLSFCIWGKPQTPGTHPETASPLSVALRGAGSVATFSSAPSTWWKQDGGVNFANRNSIHRWGIPHWGSNRPPILLAPKGYTRDQRSAGFWAQRTNWLPFRVKVSVVAVSQGVPFSGWQNYARGADSNSTITSAHLAATGVNANINSLKWTASADDGGATGDRIYRHGGQVGISATTGSADSGLATNVTSGCAALANGGVRLYRAQRGP